MATCTVRWRPSGGRGEFEFVPADSLEDRVINIFVEPLSLTIPAEVMGVRAQGKPRLRKADRNNRRKLHLPQLVMAVARLPEPAREDVTHEVIFPLENKSFIMDSMDFDIIEDDSITATLAPLRVSVLHSIFEIDLQDRFRAIAKDLEEIESIRAKHPKLAAAIGDHGALIRAGINSTEIREKADLAIALQSEIFGMTNAGSARTLEEFELKPAAEIEAEFVGKEGRMLARIHYYRERDKSFAAKVKKNAKHKNGGNLKCEACEFVPTTKYGPRGESCMEAHHKIPIEQLQPDSITRVEDMAVVCANCHRVIHSAKPCLEVTEVLTATRTTSI